MLSAAALIALWGDQLPQVERGRIGGTRLPGREDRVSARSLAAAQLAVTVWDLRNRGQLLMDVGRKKRLGFTTTTVTLAAAGTAGPAAGFAGEVLAAAGTGTPFAKLVERMLGGETLDPASALIARTHAELAAAGVMRPSTGGATLVQALSGKSPFELVPGAEAGLREGWEALRTAWASYVASQPEEADLLLKQAAGAIQYATASD